MRKKLYQFYENLIDDIKDENIREKMLDKLELIDDLIRELDYNIEDELEKQECIEDKTEDNYELYLRRVNAWIFTKKYNVLKQNC